MLKRIVIIVIAVFFVIPVVHGLRPLKVYMEGRQVIFENPVAIVNGSPSLPMLEMFEAANLEYRHSKNSRFVSLYYEDNHYLIILNTRIVFGNNQKFLLDNVVTDYNGIPQVPVDFFHKVLGFKVDWNREAHSLNIWKKNEVKIHFIDVEQGEAIFIDYGDYDILIDSGSHEKGELVSAYLQNYGTDDIELLVMTHDDEEHIGGMEYIRRMFHVETVILPGTNDNMLSLLSGEVFRLNQVTRIMQDDNMTFDLGNNVFFHILETGDGYGSSVVALLEHTNTKVLFTGDMEAAVEEKNIEIFEDIDILKAGNHGGIESTSSKFLDVTRPETVVISCSIDNPLYPSDILIKRLLNRKIDIYKTSDLGTIIATLDGKGYYVDNCSITGIEIVAVDEINKKIIIRNKTSKMLDISGCYLVSGKTGSIFRITEGSAANPGSFINFDIYKADDIPGFIRIPKYNQYLLYDLKGNL